MWNSVTAQAMIRTTARSKHGAGANQYRLQTLFMARSSGAAGDCMAGQFHGIGKDRTVTADMAAAVEDQQLELRPSVHTVKILENLDRGDLGSPAQRTDDVA